MAKNKETKHRNTALPEFQKAMHGLGSSSATQSHDSRPNRDRTRADSKRNAIRNSGW